MCDACRCHARPDIDLSRRVMRLDTRPTPLEYRRDRLAMATAIRSRAGRSPSTVRTIRCPPTRLPRWRTGTDETRTYTRRRSPRGSAGRNAPSAAAGHRTPRPGGGGQAQHGEPGSTATGLRRGASRPRLVPAWPMARSGPAGYKVGERVSDAISGGRGNRHAPGAGSTPICVSMHDEPAQTRSLFDGVTKSSPRRVRW
jgi:hypothetical protein